MRSGGKVESKRPHGKGHQSHIHTMQSTATRSVWGLPTDEFKSHYREYLRDLAQLDGDYRRELITELEWCFDRWDYWRLKFYSETAAPLWFPFFRIQKTGRELGSYAMVGDDGRPSVISLKRALLLGDRDVTLVRGTDFKLVLKAGHPDRRKVADLVILHELIHQALTESASEADRSLYISTECEGGGRRRYGGHGKLFATECNRISAVLHPELGFELAPVRHMKRDHAALTEVQRPSCGTFGVGNLLFAWDPTATDLSDEQLTENGERMKQALDYFGGAVELIKETAPEETEFLVPFDGSAGDKCRNGLRVYDRTHSSGLEHEFHLTVLRQLMADDALDELLVEVGHRPAQPIPTTTVVHKPRPIVPIDGASPAPKQQRAKRSFLQLNYPETTPGESLQRLQADIDFLGNAVAFAQANGMKDGSSVSRHLSKLRQHLKQLVAA